MFNRYKTKKKLIVACLIGVVAVSAYGFLFWAVGYVEVKINSSAAEALAVQDELDRTVKAKALLSEMEEERATIEEFYVEKDKMVDFIGDLEQSGEKIGLQVKIDSVSETNFGSLNVERWKKLIINVSTEGEWKNTYRMLFMLENLPYRSSLTRAIIQKGDKVEDVWNGSFVLEILKRQ